MSDVLLLGSAAAEVDVLRAGLDADLVAIPDVVEQTLGGDVAHDRGAWPWSTMLDDWRSETLDGPRYRRVVVAAWDVDPPASVPLVELDQASWFARHEAPFARWFAALGVASRRCAGGGTIVAVIECPAPLDCAGWAAETGLGDAVEAMVRSIARAEGHRGVRVNAVTTPIRLRPDRVVDPAPSLDRYPGTVADDVLGAVRILLDDDAVGITGTIVDADGGRSWR